MKDQLIKKHSEWTREKADKFHNFSFIDTGDEGETIWEQTDKGIFVWRHKTAHFFHVDGTIHKISRVWNEHDWEMHCKLYTRTSKFGNCRIEIPLYNEIINDSHGYLSYTIVKRPGNELGKDIFTDMITNKVDDKYFISMVCEISHLISHLTEIASVFPNIMPKLIKDSHGFVFTDIKEWTLGPRIFISNCHTRLYRTLIIFERMYGIKLNNTLILSKAEQQWNL